MSMRKSYDFTTAGATSARTVVPDVRVAEYNVGIQLTSTGAVVWNVDGTMAFGEAESVWTAIASAPTNDSSVVENITTPYSRIRIRQISGAGTGKALFIQAKC